MNRIRRICWLLAVVLLIPISMAGTIVADDYTHIITNTVDITLANKNISGNGYYWANRFDTLTLDGIHVDTESAYGLRLPRNCTVILKGTNYIKADKYAVSCAGNISFKGNGKLILEAGEIGFFLYAEDGTQKIRLLDGTYEIHAGDYGVFSTASDFSLVGGSMSITVDNPEGAAISGRIVNLLGGKFSANNAVEASHILVVKGLALDVSASRPVFAAKNLTVSDIALTTNGTSIPEYTDETQIGGVSTLKNTKNSAIFGEDVPVIVDYLCLAVGILAICAGIIGPMILRRKKAKALLARLEAENPDAAAVLKR